MSFFKKRYAKIKDDARKFASTKNVPEQSFSFYMVLQFVLIGTSIVSIATLYLISMLPIQDSIITTVLLNMVLPGWFMILLFGFGKYFFYAKILEIHYLNKALSKGLTKLDMYWWRKYRKQSPVTEVLSKMQTKGSTAKRKLTKPQKALIFIALMAVLCWLYLYDEIVSLTVSIEQIIQQNEINQNNIGKIFDGLTYKSREP